MNEFPPNYNLSGVDEGAIKWALDTLPAGANDYMEAQRYYEGIHETSFATEKWRNAFGWLFRKLKINICPVPVDTLKDRLKVNGFVFVNQMAEDGEEETDEFGDLVLPPEVQMLARRAEVKAREVWRRNRMKKRQGELFGEAILKGDSYLIIWPSKSGAATWFLNHAGTVAVSYDAENPGHIIRAAKIWKEAKKIRLTLYFSDRIEKYVTLRECETLPTQASAFVRYVEANFMGLAREPWPLPNEYGKVPVFHVANNAPLGARGRSEIKDLFPIQDGYNKTVMDMMIGGEFAALPQRYATGLELPINPQTGERYNPFEAGADRLWHVGDAEAKFGEFTAANLEQFIKVKQSFQADASLVTRTPLYYYTQQSGDVPSGEALRVLEQPLSSKVEDRQASFGGALEDAMRFSLQIEGLQNVDIECDWVDTEPKNEKDVLAVLQAKLGLGVSKRQVQREAGYTPSQIKRMETERADEATAAGAMMGGLFNKGAV